MSSMFRFLLENPKDILGTNIKDAGWENVEQWKLKISTKSYVLAWQDEYTGLFGHSLSHKQNFKNNLIQIFLLGIIMFL